MRLRAFLILVSMSACAQAATVTIGVRGTDGRSLAGAVVQIESARAPSPATRLSGPNVMAQKDISFQPHVLIVPVGASVRFPNRDKVRHHVYSFSPPKRFELKLYGQDESRSVVFDKPGIVALGCNIHDSMSGFVVVVDTPFAQQTNAQGQAGFTDVPPGPIKVSVWHPSIHAPGNMISQSMSLAPQGLSTTISIPRR